MSEFIMKPKVDFCFKELMEEPEVRRGFISAVLGIRPEEIIQTTLLPTHLRKESQEEKLGNLDVRPSVRQLGLLLYLGKVDYSFTRHHQ